MDYYKDTFLGYSVYYKYYKRPWRESGYFAKYRGVVFEYNGKSIFPTKNELYSAIGESQGYSPHKYTDAYNIALSWTEEEKNKENVNYEEIKLLIGQYDYGIHAKRELENKLRNMGLLQD